MHEVNGLNPTIKPTKRPVKIPIPSYGIYIAESHHEKGFVMRPMRNRYTKIYYILDGVAECHIEGKKVQLGQQDIFVVPEGATHYLKDNENSPLSLYILALRHSCLGEQTTVQEQIDLLDKLALEHHKPLHAHDYMAHEIPRMIKKMIYEQHVKNTGYIAALQALLLTTIVSLNRIYQNIPVRRQTEDPNGTVDRIQQVANYIASNFFEQISVEHVARMACLSVRQFTNQFKATHGVTFMQYLHYHRVRFAQSLLTQTDRQITSICFESGFNDLAHFYRVFKKITGVSPRKYRLKTINKLQEL